MRTILSMDSNASTQGPADDRELTYGTGPITWDDATWILTSSFIIFTMQSGFGLLEAGAVTSKNEVNIMVKNAVDVIFGGLSYWMVGFGLSFGVNEGVNPFCGVGYFFVDSSNDDMGLLFATFVFQLSFATTATTIVSGAMAERTKLSSYIIFSFLNTVVYCIPAHWIWSEMGFLHQLGCVDIAGSGGVHLVGGMSAFVAAILLKPRLGRYDNGTEPLPMGNTVNAIIGLFMLWWGWLGFNCGSTFGISGGKWKLAAKAAVVTLNGSMGGGAAGIIFSVATKKGKYDVGYIVNSVLGGLVSITGCAIVRPWESIIIGAIGGSLAIVFTKLIDKIKVDDPVGAVSVHGICGAWGLLSVGLFGGNDTLENLTQNRYGLFHGGGFYLLGVQTLAVVCLITWTSITTLMILVPLKYTIGIRLSPSEEVLGADVVEHCIFNDEPTTSNILFSSRSNSVASLSRQMQRDRLRRIANVKLAEDLSRGIANICFKEEPGPSACQSRETVDQSNSDPPCITSRDTTDKANTKTAFVKFLRCILLENKDSQIKELEDIRVDRKSDRSDSMSSIDNSQHTDDLDNSQIPCLVTSKQTLF